MRDRGAAIHDDACDRRAIGQYRVGVIVLGDRICHGAVAARPSGVDASAACITKARFPHVPAEVSAPGNRTQLLDDVLADVGDVHPAVRGIPAKALRVADAGRPDLPQHQAVSDKRIVGGNPVLAVPAVGACRVDAQDLPVRRLHVLRHVHRITAASAVGVADVEHPEVGLAGPCERIERDQAAIVVAKWLLQSEKLARCDTIVCRGAGRLRGPFQEYGVVRVTLAGGRVVRGRHRVSHVRPGVELSESGRPGLVELRVEGEALEASFPALRLHVPAPLRIVDTHVLRDGTTVRADAIQRSAHVAHEDVTRARFRREEHHACGHAVDVGKRRELAIVHADHIVGGANGRIRVGDGLGERRGRDESADDEYADDSHEATSIALADSRNITPLASAGPS